MFVYRSLFPLATIRLIRKQYASVITCATNIDWNNMKQKKENRIQTLRIENYISLRRNDGKGRDGKGYEGYKPHELKIIFPCDEGM